MASTIRSSAKVSVAVLTSRILGVVRDSLFARVFGVSAMTDAYVAAFRIPNLLRDLFAEGALSSAFVPTFSDALENGGRERAYRLGNLVLGAILLATGLLCLLGVLFSENLVSLIAGGFGGNHSQVVDGALFTRIMMPILVLVSISAVWMGMLNAQQRYMAPAYAPALFNVTSILCGVVVLILRLPDRTAMVIWSGGTALSGLVQALVQLPSLHRLGYRVRPTLAGLWSEPGLRRILRLMGPATVGLAAIQINIFVNTQFAASLGSGPLTYLQNAFRLFYLPVGMFGVALATVTTARASQEIAKGDREALLSRVGEGVRGVWLLALPSSVGLVVLAKPIVELLFQGGRFLPSDTLATVPIVQAYMVGVLPYSLVKVFAPGFFVVDHPRIPMIASISSVAANIIFSALTYRRLGATGLAFGTTVGALVNLSVLRLSFAGYVGRPKRSGWARDTFLFFLANGVLALVAALLWYWVIGRWVASPHLQVFGLRRLVHGIGLFTVIGAAFAAYVATLRVLKVQGSAELWEMPRRILRKFRRQ